MRIFFTKISKTNHLASRWCSFLLLGLSGLSSPGFAEVELDQLHIPPKYLRNLPKLFDGANLMQASERCKTFLQGSLSLDHSTVDHPVFRYSCRDETAKIYYLLVDGTTLHILDDTRPAGSISFADLQLEIDAHKAQVKALALQRLQEIERLEAEIEELEYLKEDDTEDENNVLTPQEKARRQHLWETCQKTLKKRTRNMASVNLITVSEPEPDWRQKALLHYSIDFDAIDYYGKTLNYRAFCQLSTDDDIRLTIHPKALAKMPSPPEQEGN